MNRRLVIVAALGVAAAVGAFFFVTSTNTRYNVVLISVDTLRPDRLGYAGHTRNTSPTIDRLASEGVVFERSYSVSGWTLPSMATILTGHYPRDHGATDFHWSIVNDMPTMATILEEEGYDTRGFVSHLLLKPIYGISEGFSVFDYSVLDIGHPHNVSTGEALTDLAIEQSSDLTEPFFLWIHYFDPHYEYLPHGSEFGDSVIDRYDGEILYTDRQIERVFSFLREKGVYDDSIIIFVSDHGEEFGEHGSEFHYTLFEEVTRIPLVIRVPNGAPDVHESPAEQTDVLPTVLSALGIVHEGEFPGRDLLAKDEDDGPIFLERDRPPPYNQRSIIDGNLKLTVVAIGDQGKIPLMSLLTTSEVTNVHPGTYMFDLSKDPLETTNIFSGNDPVAKELFVKLAKHFAVENSPHSEVKVDENLREKLRSLGYLR